MPPRTGLWKGKVSASGPQAHAWGNCRPPGGLPSRIAGSATSPHSGLGAGHDRPADRRVRRPEDREAVRGDSLGFQPQVGRLSEIPPTLKGWGEGAESGQIHEFRVNPWPYATIPSLK
jgi:hypothetical protein